MIAECAADLLARVRSVDALVAHCSLSLGGHSLDPGLLKIPLPAAWIIYGGDQPDEPPYGASGHGGPGMVPETQVMLSNWRVVVYVRYDNSDTNLLDTQYPLLDAVRDAVKRSTTTGPMGGIESPNGNRWRYTGQKISLIANDRMAYEQHYTLDMAL